MGFVIDNDPIAALVASMAAFTFAVLFIGWVTRDM